MTGGVARIQGLTKLAPNLLPELTGSENNYVDIVAGVDASAVNQQYSRKNCSNSHVGRMSSVCRVLGCL